MQGIRGNWRNRRAPAFKRGYTQASAKSYASYRQRSNTYRGYRQFPRNSYTYPRNNRKYIKYGGVNPIETKWADTTVSLSFDATGDTTAGVSTGDVLVIAQGLTQSTRIGGRICVKSLQVSGLLNYLPSTSALASTNCYLYLVEDRQPNGVYATIQDIYTGSAMYISIRYVPYMKRFRIIKKFIWNFTSSAGVSTAYNAVRKNFDWFHRFKKPLIISYTSDSGLIAQRLERTLLWVYGSDAQSDDHVTLSGEMRVRYTDQ